MWVIICMSISRDSLSGQNRGRRVAGGGSSPPPSIKVLTKSQKTKLWKRLRRYDSKIDPIKSRLDSYYWQMERYRCWGGIEHPESLKEKFNKLDAKRKDVRNKLKGY